MASDLLKAYADSSKCADDLELGDHIDLEMNTGSGYVFLADEDGGVALLNSKGELENWITCTNCGHEDFKSKIEILDDEKAGQCHKEL